MGAAVLLVTFTVAATPTTATTNVVTADVNVIVTVATVDAGMMRNLCVLSRHW